MDREQVRAWLRKWYLLWLPPVLAICGIVFYRPLLWIERFAADHILFCPFYDITGFYCPGCGGTRSLTALLHLHPLLAIHENPSVPVLLVTGILLYAEKVAALFGKPVRIVPRKLAFWLTGFGLLFIWNIARNIIPELMPVRPIN
ncbi:MAG: DUF2752 domain-containing protein [Oscillospiraceae bacterium]|nr:DUF2752 domain-containing protein [Oscillospiraceae bacterium]